MHVSAHLQGTLKRGEAAAHWLLKIAVAAAALVLVSLVAGP